MLSNQIDYKQEVAAAGIYYKKISFTGTQYIFIYLV